ncbi:FRAS1-related extracellular matrix protein 1-like [Mercenaria mercenaria]|uniref:FRAS1-related extracellular matrix protein 1-like n=1 Tax=Mercenaria mercenaria TaxID=6596 RepID=UPI00234E9C11|nr:FRAS1-related extracellular matrix protein 1-like [Mercenaria mercenaria]
MGLPMRGARICVLFLVCMCPAFIRAGLVVRTNALTVKVGRTVYLNTDDIVIKNMKRKDEVCRIEVVQNDPITQRVGKLEPKIFDCSYQANTVKYIHDGSPFLSEDRIKLRVHRFTNRKTVTETFYLGVKVSNASTEIVVTRGLRHVIVPEFNGISNTIDASVLRFYRSRTPNVSCTVSFDNSKHWPLVGHIIMGDRRTPIETIKTSCQEFLFMELRYEHLQKPTPDVDYFPLNIELHDPENSDELKTERFFLPIYIKNALLNSPPRSSYKSMYMMDVDQFVLSTIIPGIISAEDYETPDHSLVYNISKPSRPNQGYFVHLDDQTTEISSFLQDDLENHLIAYQPPNTSFSERKIYEVELKVYDSHFAESMPIVLHIAVRPSSSNAPRVSCNTGLVLLEGQSREINSNNLQIVDNNNPNDIRVYITDGLKHGQLVLNNEAITFFTISDLVQGNVRYVHDDSESERDFIKLKISDGAKHTVVKFPITIIPKDDSPPYIVNNLGIELNEGQTKRIDPSNLLAHDPDSIDMTITYVIAQPTAAGEMIRKTRASDSGTRVNRFTQRELQKGQIYYRHFGREDFHDEFLFTLRDQQDPPNESILETFYIAINPVNENPPQLSPEATRLMRVSETDIALITKSELEYTDKETGSDRLTYIITVPPYFVYSNRRNRREDAGRIIALHNLTMLSKNKNISPVATFKQEDINYLKIGYMPPMKDIGPEPRLVRFVYTVQDASGNKVLGQQFDIDIQPVNDKAPEFQSSKMLVEEGGILGISTNHIFAVDVDTNEADLTFILEDLPNHGRLQKGGNNLLEKDTFSMLDLRKKDLRYIHDGSEVTSDTFTLSLTDGANRVSKVFQVEIVPIDDVAPKLKENLKPHLIVSEGSEAVINSNVLSATDEDTDEGMLVFLIVKQPKYGIMQLNGEPVTKFTQQDVKEGSVHYIHSSGEIGSQIIRDSVAFIVSDQHYKASADLPMYNLNITITPVDNQKPIIIAGMPIVVEEGMKFNLSPDYITAKDPDTEPESIQFVITSQPQYGYLENIKPNPGSEKSNAGNPVLTFKLQDVIDKSINYVQATHKGVEPTTDRFEFYATDGKLNSFSHTASITIRPTNDEEPDVMLNDFSVPEGGSKIIDRSMVDAIDMDKPKEKIMLSISQPPEHGDIVVMLHTPNGDIQAAVSMFSADELHQGMKLKYIHDDSEHYTDKFAITVSDGKHEVKKVCNVTVEPINDEIPEIIKNAGLHMDYGEQSVLSSVVLQSVDIDNTDDQVYYIIVTVPKKGVLQFCSDSNEPMFSEKCRDIWVGHNFTQRDINNNRVRYLHTTGMSGSEFDNFMFILTDGQNKRHAETFQIKILNSKRANIALINNGLDVQEGERAVISTVSLSASDESTRAEEIVFAVIRPPNLGQLEYIDRNLIGISSFTQMDLASGKLVYNHLTKTDFTDDSFTFTVTNGMSDTKDSEFHIRIEPIDKELPSLINNELIEVLQGAEIPITSNKLKADDPDTDSSNVTYLIDKQPTFGRLYNRGVYITSLFTQSAIDRGFITYESDGSHTGLDNFLFTLSDGKHDGFLINGTLQLKQVFCRIYTKPLVNDAPKLITNQHPEVLEVFEDGRYGFHLNNNVLKAVDSDTMNTNLVYVIEQRPKHGHLENSEAKRYVRRRFTQRDLDENALQFIIDMKDKDTNDSFTFKIEDSRGNSLNNQRIDFHWSFIELDKAGLVVCENIGTLPITLTRMGDLSGVAFVGIEAQDRTTRMNDDYRPSSSRQVQFDPGVSSVTWNIQVFDDGIEENTENFVVYINDPVNAILGRKRKIRIRLINADDGECPQYIGMISKHQPSIPDSLYLPGNAIESKTETVILGNQFKRLTQQKSHHDNTLLSDPAETSEVGANKPKTADNEENPTNVQKKDKKKRRKKRKERKARKDRKKKSRKGRRKNKNREVEAEKDIAEPATGNLVSGQLMQNVDINAPQECTRTTGGLLYFDPGTQQMYKCNGDAWQAWSPASNQDQQPETRECQQGWSKYGNRCFKFINERLTWEVAETLCQMSYGANLATVQSQDHQEWVSKLAGKKAYWIGLSSNADTGRWSYSNGEALSFSNWKSGGQRVKRTLSRKTCVIVDKKRKWRNKICSKRKARFVCEIDIGAGDLSRSPPKRDTSRSRERRRRKNRLRDRQNDQIHTSYREKDSRRYPKTHSKERGFFFGE